MPQLRYTLAEHDPARPWIVIGEVQHLTVELNSVGDFAAWSAQQWPRGPFTARFGPGQEERRLSY